MRPYDLPCRHAINNTILGSVRALGERPLRTNPELGTPTTAGLSSAHAGAHAMRPFEKLCGMSGLAR